MALAEFAERVEEEHGRRLFRCLFGCCSEYTLNRRGVKQVPGLRDDMMDKIVFTLFERAAYRACGLTAADVVRPVKAKVLAAPLEELCDGFVVMLGC